MEPRIYFDNSATSPLDPRVAAAMQPYLATEHGNPSSLHTEGRRARGAVEAAREQVARLLSVEADEVVFTASGTEANNLALGGVAAAHRDSPCHLITSGIEHPSVANCCRALQATGVEVTFLPVTAEGLVEPDTLQAALRPHTRLVSIMAANNVVGTLQPITELAAVVHEHGAVFHTDAVQAVGKIPIDLSDSPIGLLSLAAHKFHGPKGVGALVVRNGVELAPLIHGGGQERGLRSATENVAGLVGLGAAAELAATSMADDAARLVQLRDHLLENLERLVPEVYLLGHRFRRLPGHLCVGLAGREGEAIKLLLALDEAGIAISTGSACSSHHAGEPSSILLAMGLDPIRARGSLRLTLGRFNTSDEVQRFLKVFPEVVEGLRPMTTSRALQATRKGESSE